MLTNSLNSKGATQITLNLANPTATYDQIDTQISTRPDFNFVVSPLYTGNYASGMTFQYLVQSTLYFIRQRERRSSDGAVLPWTPTIPVWTPLNTAPTTTPAAVMVTPAIIVAPEPASWTANSAISPASNLATDSPIEQWTGFSAGGGWIQADTSGAPIDTIALLDTNLPAGTQWQITATDTLANITSAPSFNSGFLPFHASANLTGRRGYHGLYRAASPQAYRYWRITLGGTETPPYGMALATYAVLGLARTAKNIAADKTEAALDYGSLDRTRDGIPDRRSGFRGRRVEFEIALMTEAQWETQFSDIRNKVGLTDPVLVVPNMRSGAFLHDRILYGPLATNRATHPFAPRFTQQLSVESLI